MTIEANTTRFSYTGNGVSTVFSFPSRFLSSTDIIVTVNGTQIVSGFSVAGAGNNSGGTVTFTVAPANSAVIWLDRDPPIAQLTNYEDGSATLGNTLEKNVDKLTMIAQRNRALIQGIIGRLDDYLATLSAMVATAVATVLPSIVADYLATIGFLGLPYKRETNAVAMPFLMHLTEEFSITEYGARLNDGVAYGVQITNAVNAALSEGKSIRIPAGRLRCSAPIVIDKTADSAFTTSSKRPSIIGDGPGNTFVEYTGSNGFIRVLGGGTGEGQGSFQTIRGMTILGSPTGTTKAIELDHVAWLSLKDLYITGFDFNITGRDVEYLQCDAVVLRFNERGPYFTTRDPPDANSSNPNAHLWRGCTIAHQKNYGMFYDRPNGLTIIGGDIQYNGLGRDYGEGWGLRVDNAGLQGGIGLTVIGTYIEHNAGLADVWLRQTEPAYAAVNACAYNIAADFKRSLNPALGRTDHFVAVDFLTASAAQSVDVSGSTFKNFNGNSFITDTVGFIGQKKRVDIDLLHDGCVFSGGEGIPNLTAYTPTFGATGSVGSLAITAGAASFWSRNGKRVHAEGYFTPSNVTGTTGLLAIGLPFTPAGTPLFTVGNVVNANTLTPAYGGVSGGDPYLRTNIPAAGQAIIWSVDYDMA